jgi:hypothetical protein
MGWGGRMGGRTEGVSMIHGMASVLIEPDHDVVVYRERLGRLLAAVRAARVYRAAWNNSPDTHRHGTEAAWASLESALDALEAGDLETPTNPYGEG